MEFREPILENLTKAELIELIRHNTLEPSRADIAHIMWKSETAAAQTERETAIRVLDKTKADFSMEAHKGRMTAHRLFDSALASEKEATAFYLNGNKE